jgi:hypothetical protein
VNKLEGWKVREFQLKEDDSEFMRGDEIEIQGGAMTSAPNPLEEARRLLGECTLFRGLPAEERQVLISRAHCDGLIRGTRFS